MGAGDFANFPRDVRLLTPLSRKNFSTAFTDVKPQAFTNVQLECPLPADDERHTEIYSTIFKNEKWLDMVSKIRSQDVSPPNPGLLGMDLLREKLDGAYLALVVSDWTGDARYETEKLFASFREQDYEYDAERSEVRFKKSRITLHIGDAIKSEECLLMANPRKLFRLSNRELQTVVFYYKDTRLYQIGPDKIGGIENHTTRRKKRVKYVCSIELLFGDGRPVYLVIQRPHMNTELEATIEGRKRTWRLTRRGERYRGGWMFWYRTEA